MHSQAENKNFTEIHIAVGFDRNYYNPFCALAESIKRHHQGVKVTIHAIAPGLSADLRQKITDYLQQSIQVCFYEINEELAGRFVLRGEWTMAVYFKLFLPLLLRGKVNRFIYLDTDIIINNSLLPLFNTDFGDFPVAAVYDNYVKSQPLIGLNEEGRYFNSGMLLINVQKWNDQQISGKAFDYLLSHPQNIRFVDQCALNAALIDNWHNLPFQYNFMYTCFPHETSSADLKNILEEVVVIHYTLTRPWEMLCINRLRNLYRKNLLASGIREGKSIWTDFDSNNIGKFLRIRMVEFYFDSGLLKSLYRKIKQIAGLRIN